MYILRIEEIMKEKEIGVTELANILNVNRQTVYYYIKQDDKNPISQLQKIADALGVPIAELFGKPSDEIVGAVRIGNNIHAINSKEDIRKLAEDLQTLQITSIPAEEL